MNPYPSTDAVRDLIATFESHELPRADWTHRADLTVAAYRVVDECTDREIPYTYYSRERLMSSAARREWIEPDLAPLLG